MVERANVDPITGITASTEYLAGLNAALRAIAAIPAPGTAAQMNGHEDAYRAVEALAKAAAASGAVARSSVRPAAPQRMVGCEGTDGLIRRHAESETCDVCGGLPVEEAGQVHDGNWDSDDAAIGGLPINDAVPAPTEVRPGNLFLWNWVAMQQYGRACAAQVFAHGPYRKVDDVMTVNGIALDEVVKLGDRYAATIERRGMPRAAQVFAALVMIGRHALTVQQGRRGNG